MGRGRGSSRGTRGTNRPKPHLASESPIRSSTNSYPLEVSTTSQGDTKQASGSTEIRGADKLTTNKSKLSNSLNLLKESVGSKTVVKPIPTF